MKYQEFGGQYVPQNLKEKLNIIENEFKKTKRDKEFIKEYKYYLKEYVGRPTPLYYASNLTKYIGGAKIYLKREDLNHTGVHKINNALGQALLIMKQLKHLNFWLKYKKDDSIIVNLSGRGDKDLNTIKGY